MPLVTFKAKRRLYTEEELELIERGIVSFEDNTQEWNWGIRTTSVRSEDIQTIEAFSPRQTLIFFYEEGFLLVQEPEKKVREKLNRIMEEEDDRVEYPVEVPEQTTEEDEDPEDA